MIVPRSEASLRRSSTTVIRGGLVYTGGAAPSVVAGDLVIENGVVAGIEPRFAGHTDVELDASECLVLPGMINAHTHPGASPLLRGIAEDVQLPDEGAFYHSTVPVRRFGLAELGEDGRAALMEWDAVAMLLGGATTIINEDFGGASLWLDLVERLGFRSYLGLTYPANIGAIGYVQNGQIVRDQADDVFAGLQRGLAMHDEWNGRFNDRLRVHLSPHAPDTVPEPVLVETRREATRRGITIHLHLAQHLSEKRAIEERAGKTPVQYLADLGFLGPDVLATHATYTDKHDWDLFAATGTNVIQCPYRKAKEGLSGPLWELLDRGVNVALATDAFSHDLLEDLKLGALLGKVRQHPLNRPHAEHLVQCATQGAARALGRADLGRLTPGARGDAVVISLTSPFNAPAFDPLRSVVYYSSGADVRHSTVDGRPVVRDGQVVGVDADALRRKVSVASKRIWLAASEASLLPAGVRYTAIQPSPRQLT